MWLPKNLLGDLGSQFPKIRFRTSFVLRADLVKLQLIKAQPEEVLERLCNDLLLGLLLLLLVLLLLNYSSF